MVFEDHRFSLYILLQEEYKSFNGTWAEFVFQKDIGLEYIGIEEEDYEYQVYDIVDEVKWNNYVKIQKISQSF